MGISAALAVACDGSALQQSGANGSGDRGRLTRAAVAFVVILAPGVHAQQPDLIELTLQSAVELAMGQSYRVRRLQMGILVACGELATSHAVPTARRTTPRYDS